MTRGVLRRNEVTEAQLLMYETDYGTTVLSLEALFDNVRKRHAELIRAEIADPALPPAPPPPHAWYGPREPLLPRPSPSALDLERQLSEEEAALGDAEPSSPQYEPASVPDGPSDEADGFDVSAALDESLRDAAGADARGGAASSASANPFSKRSPPARSVEEAEMEALLSTLPAPEPGLPDVAEEATALPPPPGSLPGLPGAPPVDLSGFSASSNIPGLAIARPPASPEAEAETPAAHEVQELPQGFETFEAMLIHGAAPQHKEPASACHAHVCSVREFVAAQARCVPEC